MGAEVLWGGRLPRPSARNSALNDCWGTIEHCKLMLWRCEACTALVWSDDVLERNGIFENDEDWGTLV